MGTGLTYCFVIYFNIHKSCMKYEFISKIFQNYKYNTFWLKKHNKKNYVQ